MSERVNRGVLRGLFFSAGAWLAIGAATGCGVSEAPVGVDCSAHPSCGVDGAPCAAGTDCISIRGCNTAICISTGQACSETCGDAQCLILESYPAQIACDGRDPVPGRPGTGPEPVSCEALERQQGSELAQIQRCTTDAECGQPLRGTSCGCTRNLVARTDADTTRFYEILDELSANECGGLVSTCDCPAADGFVCSAGRCAWNYTR